MAGVDGHGCFNLKETFQVHICQAKEETSDPSPAHSSPSSSPPSFSLHVIFYLQRTEPLACGCHTECHLPSGSSYHAAWPGHQRCWHQSWAGAFGFVRGARPCCQPGGWPSPLGVPWTDLEENGQSRKITANGVRNPSVSLSPPLLTPAFLSTQSFLAFPSHIAITIDRG